MKGGGTPSLEQILTGLKGLIPEWTNPECHYLVSGDWLLRRLSQETIHALNGRRQQLLGDGYNSWRRPHFTDGAFPTVLEQYRIELRGVRFGYRSRRQVEHILQPVGRLHRIVCNGIHKGNPNCLCVDVEVRTGGPIPASIQAYGGGRVLKYE